jgi:hypothetical protein
VKLEAPDDLPIEHVSLADLPVKKTEVTRAMGDRWLEANRSPLLIGHLPWFPRRSTSY